MISASVVLYKTSETELNKIISCVVDSKIDLLYLIDNSPDDRLSKFALINTQKIVYIFNDNNLGYGAAHNIALKKSLESTFTYHIVLNPDIVFEPNTIEKLYAYMQNNINVATIMPKVLYPNGQIQYLCKLQPTPLNLFARRFIPFKNITSKLDYIYELRFSGYDKIMNVPCLSGCFMFLRTSILKEVGFFDENFFMYCEDFDFYKRIHKKYKTIFYPHVSIVHSHAKESHKNKKMLLIHIKSAIYYFNKWGWFFDKDRKKANKKIIQTLKNNNL